jgi:hypothetical protein
MLGRQAQMELVMSVVDMVTLLETVQRRDRKDQQVDNKRLSNVTIVGNGVIHGIGVFSCFQSCALRHKQTVSSRRSLLGKEH